VNKIKEVSFQGTYTSENYFFNFIKAKDADSQAKQAERFVSHKY